MVRQEVNAAGRNWAIFGFAEPRNPGALFFARQAAELGSDPRGRHLPRVHIQSDTIPGRVRGKILRRLLTNFLLLLMFLLLPCASRAAQLTGVPLGTYSGTLQAGEAQLHLLLHLSKGTNGSLRPTLDSLEQNVFAHQARSVCVSYFNLE